MSYEILDVSGYKRDEVEPLGTKSKYWCTGPGGKEFLFKSIVTFDSKFNLVSRGGEDWAEKVACELAKFLSVPCATYDLAHDGESRGVITPNFLERKSSYLITGNEVLKNYSSAVPVEAEKRSEKQNIMHVYIILRRIIRNKPLGFNSLPGIKTAADFFTGYLMLDALISNQDRHSENWGLVVTEKGSRHLAPSFDHAASLARNESDETKCARLLSKDKGQQVSTYVTRAKSYFYLRDKRLRTMKAFGYWGVLRPLAALSWLERLDKLTYERMRAIIDLIPMEVMSDESKKFALEMLVCNKSNMMEMVPFFERNLNSSYRKWQIENYE
ncbi:hypothetical protein ACNFG0_09235 [Pseudomonas sp. NY15372]|uniref:hypothetical protein n=1 Tax=Pseudomonas sp. NY15372 TaxID=3400356 RepID=UPI003A870BA1